MTQVEIPTPEFYVEGNTGNPRCLDDGVFQRSGISSHRVVLSVYSDYEVDVEWLSFDTVGYHILFERGGCFDLGNFQRSTFCLLGTVYKWTFEDAFLVSRRRDEPDSIVFRRMWVERRV